MCLSLKLRHYKRYPKQKIKLQSKFTFFTKSLNIQCFSIFSLFLCYLLFLGCYCCKLAPFLTYNLSEYSLILFMDFCIQIHQLPSGSSSTKESREFWAHFHKNYPKVLESTRLFYLITDFFHWGMSFIQPHLRFLSETVIFSTYLFILLKITEYSVHC